jgi:dienelactone hydrolase
VLDTVIWYPTGGEGPFPLVVFSHGLGGDPGNIAAVVDDWVRAGFVVAAPNFPLSRADHPGGPDAGDVQNQAGDVSFLIDTLTGTLDGASPVAGLVDGERVGVAGHSNGAITTLGVTAHSCCRDERIDAALEMAGTPSPFGGGEYDFGRAPPYLIVHGTDDPLVNYANAVSVFNSLQGPKALLTIEGGDHGGYLGTAGRGHDALVGTTVDFWLAYLADDANALARLTSATSPDPFVTVNIAPEEGSTATIATVPSTAEREAIATPTSGLTSGQLVTVTWSGFLPGGTINIVQCSQGGTAGSQACDLTTGFLLRPNPTGAGTVELPIVAGAVGNGRCEAGITDCAILVNDSGLPEPEATIMIPLNFAA